MNPYEILGVQPGASLDELKAARRRAGRLHHPDLNGGDSTRMQEINDAFAVLTNPARLLEQNLPVEQVAEEIVAALFEHSMADERVRDSVAWVRHHLTGCIAEAKQQIRLNTKRIRELEIRKLRVMRRGEGDNLMHRAADARIAELTAVEIELRGLIEVSEAGLRLLSEYVSSEVGLLPMVAPSSAPSIYLPPRS